MTIDIVIGDRIIDRVYVVNEGPTSPDEAHPGGERRYTWRHYSVVGNGATGVVTHHRDDGALALAAIVLDAANVRTRQ